jgi:hypothetical protein
MISFPASAGVITNDTIANTVKKIFAVAFIVHLPFFKRRVLSSLEMNVASGYPYQKK